MSDTGCGVRRRVKTVVVGGWRRTVLYGGALFTLLCACCHPPGKIDYLRRIPAECILLRLFDLVTQ